MQVCCVYKSLRVCMWCVYMYGCIPVCVYISIRVSSCVLLLVAVIQIQLRDPSTVTEDLYPIQIRVSGVPIRQPIQRSMHEMIRRSITFREVKTKRRFESKTVSFHVSVCSYVIFLFTVVSRHFCIISCEWLIYFTSIITRITSWSISERSLYLFRWYEHLSVSFHVLVVRCYWLRPSINIS